MKISKIVQESKILENCEIINEQEFEVLMLSESKCTKPACIFIDNMKFIEHIPSNVAMVITNSQLKEYLVKEGRGVIVTEEPRIFFFLLHNYLSKSKEYTRKRYVSQIDSSAVVSQASVISEYNVTIGKNVLIEPFVMIHSDVCIGDNSIIRAGAVIGGTGFEFKRTEQGIIGVSHVGGVVIGQNVEVQNNTCIDKAIYPWDDTEIGDYTKIDNLVHVAHGVKIDKNVMIVANSGIGGRVEIHENSWIGFGATIRNGVEIGRDARANMGAVVTKNIPDNTSVTGNFAINHQDFIANMKKRG